MSIATAGATLSAVLFSSFDVPALLLLNKRNENTSSSFSAAASAMTVSFSIVSALLSLWLASVVPGTTSSKSSVNRELAYMRRRSSGATSTDSGSGEE